jgi:peroxiredoxin
MKKIIKLSLFAALFALSFTLPTVGGYQIGDKAEDFSLKNVDGKMVSLASIPNAKGYIVVFTCNGCPYAQAYEQRIIDLHNKYAPQGYPVIAINPNDPTLATADSYDKMQARAKSKKYPFVYLLDEKQDVFPEFGATRTPHVFVLDKDKILKYMGGIDDNADDASAVTIKYVENAVEAIKSGKSLEQTSTKAIGCSIKKKRT